MKCHEDLKKNASVVGVVFHQQTQEHNVRACQLESSQVGTTGRFFSTVVPKMGAIITVLGARVNGC